MVTIKSDKKGDLNIRCGQMKLYGHMLSVNHKACYLNDDQLDDLYEVLHAREQSKQWNKEDQCEYVIKDPEVVRMILNGEGAFTSKIESEEPNNGK